MSNVTPRNLNSDNFGNILSLDISVKSSILIFFFFFFSEEHKNGLSF